MFAIKRISLQSVKSLSISKNLFKLKQSVGAKMSCSNISNISYLNQTDAINLDQDLFNECKFSVDQLMELAGLSVASIIKHCYPIEELPNNRVIIACGPGNNGGDGLVAARHLKLFGYNPQVYYPKRGSSELFERLVKQLESFDIEIVSTLNNDLDHSLILDALFGFSFKPPVRPQFVDILNLISNANKPKQYLISVDIPSGWHVENGQPTDDQTPILKPDCLISLTAPKLCAQKFAGKHHYLGGRFIPNKIAKKYNLVLPAYSNYDQFVKL